MEAGYLQGSHYPCGRGSAITEQLARVVRAHGGEVEPAPNNNRHRSDAVCAASLDATAALASDLLAPVVVSAMDIKATFLELLPAGAVPSMLRRRVRGYELPFLLPVVYLVLDRALPAEGHPNTKYLPVRR